MAKIWSTITTFTILFLLDLWLMTSTDRSHIDIFPLARNKSEVPIFGLSLGTLLAVLSSALMLALIPRSTRASWVERVPTLWVDPTEHARFRCVWKGATLFMAVVFPLGAQFHFWRKFHHRDFKAWINDGSDPPTLVSLYEPVSPLLIFDWDKHRYGNPLNMQLSDGGGVSYLPLWQPVLMVMLSLASLILAVAILRRVFAR